ncbi:MAG TPA: glycosyltransferase family 4 protein [Acidimicrobiales bacterium]|nr:glycosyltransferase family 4 protein [Acidimicrobiales bacterium]
MPVAVHQFLPTFAEHDAIGMHVRRLQRLLRGAGYASDVYADDIHAEVRGRALPFRDFRPAPGERPWVLYHSSTGSTMAAELAGAGLPLVVDYHNITLPRFFERWEPLAAHSMRAGREQLRVLAPAATFGIADSTFNEADLVRAGFARTAVSPILVDFADYDVAPDQRALARLRKGGGPLWLFVGRVAPNKCQHDVIAAFAAYRRLHAPDARLRIVGGRTSQLYWQALEELIADLGLGDAVRLTDSISFPELLAHYEAADVFVCLSEHEGFCVPVLEAMRFDVPVVAYGASAVPETVGDAAVVLPGKDPVLVAAAVDRVLSDDALRRSLVDAGRARVEHFSLEHTGKQMLDTVTSVVGPADG